MMRHIALVNMPFASAMLPSLALTQLKSVMDASYAGQLRTDIYYLNQDFAQFFGPTLYHSIAFGAHQRAGLGEWIFRQAAFPDLPDNSTEYFEHFYSPKSPLLRTYARESVDPLTADISEASLHGLRHTISEKRQLLDAFLDQLIARYQLDQADLVGFTSMFAQTCACLAMARKLKERCPNITTVMGGANCESPMGQEIVMHAHQMDYVFSGPALKSFPQFVSSWLQGRKRTYDQIPGVFSRTNVLLKQTTDATGRRTYRDPIGQDLDINFPIELEYTSFFQHLRSTFPDTLAQACVLFETSRGCWWGERAQCTFCGLNGLTMNYRAMTPSRAVSLVNGLIERYASTCTTFQAVDNILPRSFLTDVLPHVKRPPHVTIFYEVKADLSDAEVEVLARAGVRSIQPGIESLATSTLKLMRKGTSATQNIRLLKSCLRHGVVPVWNLLVGFPGEAEMVYQHYLRVIPLLTHLPPPSGLLPVRFDRFSIYFEEPERYGLDLRPYDYYALTFPFDGTALLNLAYYFRDHHDDAVYRRTTLQWLGSLRECVYSWIQSWQGRERAARPRLEYAKESDVTTVTDSRTGERFEHVIAAATTAVLEELAQPHRLGDLAKMPHLQHVDVEQEVARLQQLGLLFEEDGRYLSLVLPAHTGSGATGRRDEDEMEQRQES